MGHQIPTTGLHLPLCTTLHQHLIHIARPPINTPHHQHTLSQHPPIRIPLFQHTHTLQSQHTLHTKPPTNPHQHPSTTPHQHPLALIAPHLPNFPWWRVPSLPSTILRGRPSNPPLPSPSSALSTPPPSPSSPSLIPLNRQAWPYPPALLLAQRFKTPNLQSLFKHQIPSQPSPSRTMRSKRKRRNTRTIRRRSYLRTSGRSSSRSREEESSWARQYLLFHSQSLEDNNKQF